MIFHLLFWPFFAYSIIAHEVAHAWVAKLVGDDTADRMGRITANPIPHIDPIMSIVVPLFLYFSTAGSLVFGAARPVMVNPLNFRRRVSGDILVSIAGVITNFLIAFVMSVVLRFLDPRTVNYDVFHTLMLVNIFLMLFNLIPIPPLDGSHVIKYLLPTELRRGFERIGFFGIFIIIIIIQLPQVRFAIRFILTSIIRLFYIDGGYPGPPMGY